ncbi:MULTISPECIES: hypothetical protein [unclassified Microcoleus]|uniref:hypothetical protein n=1 Tax=unclassified Microcoleus TaxID=2642155 RepID=UPI002FD08B1E
MSATEKLLGQLSPQARSNCFDTPPSKTQATSRTTKDTGETTVVRATGAIVQRDRALYFTGKREQSPWLASQG